ncbi:cyclin-like protein interacting with PHO85 [Coemansia aciculifera]|nr:cyclin-like protein interacting with PHO85 [Coemansia aciculifera]
MFDIERTPISLTIARMAELIDAVTTANHRMLGPIINDITQFHSRAVPAISVHDYLERVAKFVCLENDSLIAVLVYLDRVTRAQIHRPALALSPFNIHRLLITAIVIAHKFNSDIFFNNARYAKVGGIPLAEMNQLELELLFLARFDLKIDAPEMQRIGEWLTAPRSTMTLALGVSSASQHRQQAMCILSTYHADVALARQAELCRLEYPTPAMDPMTAGNGGASVPLLDLAASLEGISSVPRNIPNQHCVPSTRQSGASIELRTPSSLNASCPPTTPPSRWCPNCDINQLGGQYLCPHSAEGGSQPRLYSASAAAGDSFDSGVAWPDNCAYSPSVPENPMLECALLTQKRRRIVQPLGVHPALTVPPVTSGGGVSTTLDVSASGLAPHTVNAADS